MNPTRGEHAQTARSSQAQIGPQLPSTSNFSQCSRFELNMKRGFCQFLVFGFDLDSFLCWPWYTERAVAEWVFFSDCMELEVLEEVAWNSVPAFQDADDTARLLTAGRKFGLWAAPVLPLRWMMSALRPGRGRLRSLARASVGFSWALCLPGVGVFARLCWRGICGVQTTFKFSPDPLLRPSV